MDNEVELHLSGGVFFNLILAARKTNGANQETCLKGLLCIFDRSAKGLSGNSLKTIASRFRNCDPELNSDYIKCGDPVKTNAFDGRMKEDYAAVLKEIKDYSDKYLDVETNGKWLVRSLLELIEADRDIKENTKFVVIPGGIPAYRDELKEMATVYFYSFLLGVWRYICADTTTENGQDTYFYLSDFVSESRPRNLKKDRIGFEKYENVEISYEMELPEVEIKATGRAGRILEVTTGTSVIRKEKNAAQVFGGLDNTVEAKKDFPVTIEYVHHDEESAINRYLKYLEHAKAKHELKKSFLYETRRPFYSFFVCNDVKKRSGSYGAVVRREEKQEKPIENITIESFPEDQRCIILSGTGGLGKSMMMTHFMLDTIKNNGVNGRVPIFVTLRDYNPEKAELIDFVFQEFKRHDTDLRLPNLTELLQSGKAVVLFDGLDEIKKEYLERFVKEVNLLADNYPDSMYVISSRPTLNFRAIENFMPYDLQPFNTSQSVKMVEKLDQSVIDPQVQKDFIDDLRCNRFKFSYDERTEFLGNPLFLTIMLLSYEGNHDIPTQRYLFYEQAYEAMAKKHDATKALTRDFATGLNSRDFQKYFGEFCAITYEQQKYDFEPSEIEEAFQEVIDANGLETTPEAFIEDVTGKICLIYRDGDKYFFVHRSFQEYFVAYFFSKQLEQNYDAIREMFWCYDESYHESMVLPMLFDMDQKKTELCILLPYLKEFAERYSGEEGYKSFLFRHYPTIFYEWGDTDGIPENESESSMYCFIVNKYDIAQVISDGSLPYFDVMVDKEFVNYESEYGDGRKVESSLMEKYKLPSGYEERYEEVNDEPVEIVGCTYEIDVTRAYEKDDIYHEVVEILEDESFPLKVEYNAVLKKYEELKEKYAKQENGGQRRSFISRFH